MATVNDSAISISPRPGVLIITDPKVLIRPPRPNVEYPRYAKHDTAHANTILGLGNDDLHGEVPCHIIFSGTPLEAYAELNDVFHYFLDACVMDLDCDARVDFVVNGVLRRREEYGVGNGYYTLFYTVHCGVTDPEAHIASLLAAAGDCHRTIVRPDDSERGFVAVVVESNAQLPLDKD